MTARGSAAPIREVQRPPDPQEVWIRQARSETFLYRHRWILLLLGMLAIMVMGVVFAIGTGAWFLWRSDWIMPGVHVLGVDLGKQSRDDAAAALSAYWERKEILLQSDEGSLAVRPESLGMTFDEEATVQLAYLEGRSPERLVETLIGGGSVNVPPVWMLNPAQARKHLTTLAPNFYSAPVDASVQVADGRVTVAPPVNGRRLDVDASLNALIQNSAQVLASGRLQLLMEQVQATITDVSAVADQAEKLLATSVTITAYDPVTDQTASWELGPESWSDWLSLSVTDSETGQFSWSLDLEQSRAYLMTHVQALGADQYLDWEAAVSALRNAIADQNGEVTLRVFHRPTQHIVQSGETLASIGRAYGIPYPWIQQANSDIGAHLSPGQVLIIPSPDEFLPLPVVEDKRIEVSISQQRMWAYEGGDLKWEWPVSTGIDESPTSPGVFQIQTHETNAYAGNWDLWMPYFMGIYRPVPTSGFMNGFHGFPTRDGANLLWTGDLGHQVTFGCILISTVNAIQLFEWAEPGVVVVVQR